MIDFGVVDQAARALQRRASKRCVTLSEQEVVSFVAFEAVLLDSAGRAGITPGLLVERAWRAYQAHARGPLPRSPSHRAGDLILRAEPIDDWLDCLVDDSSLLG